MSKQPMKSCRCVTKPYGTFKPYSVVGNADVTVRACEGKTQGDDFYVTNIECTVFVDGVKKNVKVGETNSNLINADSFFSNMFAGQTLNPLKTVGKTFTGMFIGLGDVEYSDRYGDTQRVISIAQTQEIAQETLDSYRTEVEKREANSKYKDYASRRNDTDEEAEERLSRRKHLFDI